MGLGSLVASVTRWMPIVIDFVAKSFYALAVSGVRLGCIGSGQEFMLCSFKQFSISPPAIRWLPQKKMPIWPSWPEEKPLDDRPPLGLVESALAFLLAHYPDVQGTRTRCLMPPISGTASGYQRWNHTGRFLPD